MTVIDKFLLLFSEFDTLKLFSENVTHERWSNPPGWYTRIMDIGSHNLTGWLNP
jgi:hypothetical protein